VYLAQLFDKAFLWTWLQEGKQDGASPHHLLHHDITLVVVKDEARTLLAKAVPIGLNENIRQLER
jgi:hypothetical protein